MWRILNTIRNPIQLSWVTCQFLTQNHHDWPNWALKWSHSRMIAMHHACIKNLNFPVYTIILSEMPNGCVKNSKLRNFWMEGYLPGYEALLWLVVQNLQARKMQWKWRWDMQEATLGMNNGEFPSGPVRVLLSVNVLFSKQLAQSVRPQFQLRLWISQSSLS